MRLERENVTVTNCDGTPAICAMELVMLSFALGSLTKAEALSTATLMVIEPVMRATGIFVLLI